VERYAHRLDEASRDAWQKPEEVIALLACPEGGTAVDLGAGTGYFIPYLAQAVGPEGRVVALDISAGSVKWLGQLAEELDLQNVEVRRVEADDPALERRSADRILVVNTWHHIEGRVGYAKKLFAALGRRGRLLIVDFTMESPTGPPPAKRLTVDTVVEELRAAGFEVEVLEESLPHHYIVAARAR
jgi:predicted methyltransferase